MANQVLLKRSGTASKVPLVADLVLGELAINTFDGKLFLKKNNGSDAIIEVGAVTSVAGRTGAVVLTKSDVGLANVENKTSATIRSELTSSNVTTALGFTPADNAKLGVASGIATLDGTGKILSSQLPALTITDTFVVASQAAMLALTAETGDVAVRTDLSKSFILKGASAATLGDWQELLTPSDVVQSVAGRTGAVTLSNADVAGSAPLASPALTGNPTAPTAATGDNSTSIATTAFVKAQGYVTSTGFTNGTIDGGAF